MNISLTNPTGRKTEARIVTLDNKEFFFSYRTCIGVRGCFEGKHIKQRLENTGPTTGRHMNELGIRDFEVVESFDSLKIA